MKHYVLGLSVLLALPIHAGDLFNDPDAQNLTEVMGCAIEVDNAIKRQITLVQPAARLFQKNLTRDGIHAGLTNITQELYGDHGLDFRFNHTGAPQAILEEHDLSGLRGNSAKRDLELRRHQLSRMSNTLFTTMYRGADELDTPIISKDQVEVEFPHYTEEKDVRVSFPMKEDGIFKVSSSVSFDTEKDEALTPDKFTLQLYKTSPSDNNELEIVFNKLGEYKLVIPRSDSNHSIKTTNIMHACQVMVKGRNMASLASESEYDIPTVYAEDSSYQQSTAASRE